MSGVALWIEDLLRQRARRRDAGSPLRQAAEAGDHAAMYDLAEVYDRRGDLPEAVLWYGRYVRAGHTEALAHLTRLLEEQGRLAEAQRWRSWALVEAERFSESDVKMLTERVERLQTQLAELAEADGDPCDVEGTLRRRVADLEQVQGPDSESLMDARIDLGRFLASSGRHEAVELYGQVFDHRRRVLGVFHPATITGAADLATTLSRVGRDRAAVTLWRTLLPLATHVLGADHPVTRDARAATAGG